MNGFLLDTNVLSEFARSAVPPDPRVKQWIETARADALFASVLTLGEIRKGIEILPQSKKRTELEQWVSSDLNGWFGDNLLPVTRAISNRWGVLAAVSQKDGRPLGNIEGLLAATALEHNLTVATRNTRHFSELGVDILNPWQRR